MSAVLKRISAFFRVGRARYLAGRDLDNNSYYEYPPLDGNPDPRRTRRLVRFRVHKELGEYDQSTLPTQWLMWLRHTRRSAPTIEELAKDRERIAMTQHNAWVLEQRDLQRRQKLEHKAQGDLRERQQIEAETYQTKQTVDPRATVVPTSTVTDAEASAEADRRVPYEKQKDPQTVYQQRQVDMQVWEASRRRLEEQDQRMQPAAEARAARRSELDARDAERDRARRVMGQSPLSAFDVSIVDEKQQVQQENRQQNQNATRSGDRLKPRFGKPVGPSEEWRPEEWQPRPAVRR